MKRLLISLLLSISIITGAHGAVVQPGTGLAKPVVDVARRNNYDHESDDNLLIIVVDGRAFEADGYFIFVYRQKVLMGIFYDIQSPLGLNAAKVLWPKTAAQVAFVKKYQKMIKTKRSIQLRLLYMLWQSNAGTGNYFVDGEDGSLYHATVDDNNPKVFTKKHLSVNAVNQLLYDKAIEVAATLSVGNEGEWKLQDVTTDRESKSVQRFVIPKEGEIGVHTHPIDKSKKLIPDVGKYRRGVVQEGLRPTKADVDAARKEGESFVSIIVTPADIYIVAPAEIDEREGVYKVGSTNVLLNSILTKDSEDKQLKLSGNNVLDLWRKIIAKELSSLNKKGQLADETYWKLMKNEDDPKDIDTMSRDIETKTYKDIAF